MIFTLTLNPALDLEYTVDHIRMGEVHRAAGYRADLGGKGFNVSRVLKTLGENTTAVGFAGGQTGKTLAAGLRSLEIPAVLIEISGETRANISIVGEAQGEYVKVNHPGPRVSQPDIEALYAKIGELTNPGDLWVFSGSLPPGTPSDFYARAIATAAKAGAKSILDASGPPLRLACAARPYLVKPNGEEAQELVGISVTDFNSGENAARAIVALGVERVVLSMGAQGAVGMEGSQVWRAFSPRIQAANPVGAGDALVAGLAAGIQRGWQFQRCLALGIACGASAAMQPGTGIGSLDEIERLVEQTEMSRL